MNKNQKTILIIEDKISLIGMVVEKLEREGFGVLIAENGKVGLEMALKHHPDVILLDLVMPDINGLELLDNLRTNEDKWGESAEVILLTDLDNEKITSVVDRDKCCDCLLNIAWNTEDVVAKVKEKFV